mgnify:CR=1 FL=1|tara:strand:+ start:5657 stop:5785 length:129 start_codon:yes stop_codon:yes gene_type:complete
MSNAYDAGKTAQQTNKAAPPKMSNHADQQKADAGFAHAKQGK